MKAINIIKHIETQGVNNSQYTTFRYHEDFYLNNSGPAEFVRQHFGGDFVAGQIKPGADYVAFWKGSEPEQCTEIDAVFTDNSGGKIYVYEVE